MASSGFEACVAFYQRLFQMLASHISEFYNGGGLGLGLGLETKLPAWSGQVRIWFVISLRAAYMYAFMS
jgi:hypothetical protein